MITIPTMEEARKLIKANKDKSKDKVEKEVDKAVAHFVAAIRAGKFFVPTATTNEEVLSQVVKRFAEEGWQVEVKRRKIISKSMKGNLYEKFNVSLKFTPDLNFKKRVRK